MSKVLSQGLMLLLLIFSPLLLAKQELRVGVGNFPPFFMEKDNKGIFLEITQAVFAQLPDYEVKFIFMSNSRLLHEINNGKIIDVACNVFSGSEIKGYLSEALFRYTDVAVSKKSKAFQINEINDLKKHSIAAYQGAKDLLGEKYKQMAITNSNYSEHPHPKETTYLMLSGEKDIRVGDINIFLHDLKSKSYKDTIQMNKDDFSIHRLWPDVYSHMAFKDAELRNSVNKIIKQLKQDGTIERIYAEYQIQK
ncbi:MAG: amino acid ABC transporter substrate-binding protein [Colwellia sp.]|nr:amino acid ABC transporter substrate-binding protein [Colwellia sp.]